MAEYHLVVLCTDRISVIRLFQQLVEHGTTLPHVGNMNSPTVDEVQRQETVIRKRDIPVNSPWIMKYLFSATVTLQTQQMSHFHEYSPRSSRI